MRVRSSSTCAVAEGARLHRVTQRMNPDCSPTPATRNLQLACVVTQLSNHGAHLLTDSAELQRRSEDSRCRPFEAVRPLTQTCSSSWQGSLLWRRLRGWASLQAPRCCTMPLLLSLPRQFVRGCRHAARVVSERAPRNAQ